MGNEILLRQRDDGVFEKYEPFATIVCDTEEDFNKLKIAVEKQIPKKPVPVEPPFMDYMKCPSCGEPFDCDEEYYLKYGKRHCCANCGQRIGWGYDNE